MNRNELDTVPACYLSELREVHQQIAREEHAASEVCHRAGDESGWTLHYERTVEAIETVTLITRILNRRNVRA